MTEFNPNSTAPTSLQVDEDVAMQVEYLSLLGLHKELIKPYFQDNNSKINQFYNEVVLASESAKPHQLQLSFQKQDNGKLNIMVSIEKSFAETSKPSVTFRDHAHQNENTSIVNAVFNEFRQSSLADYLNTLIKTDLIAYPKSEPLSQEILDYYHIVPDFHTLKDEEELKEFFYQVYPTEEIEIIDENNANYLLVRIFSLFPTPDKIKLIGFRIKPMSQQQRLAIFSEKSN